MKRLSHAVGGRANRQTLQLLIYFGGLHKPGLEADALLKALQSVCQFNFIYNHQPGNTPNDLCLAGLRGLSKSCILLLHR